MPFWRCVGIVGVCWLLLGPGSAAWATLAYVTESAGQSDASATTIAVTQAGVTAGNAKVCWVKHEGAATSITVSDGTTSFTADPLGVQDHSNGDLHGEMFYLLSSAASGSVTYTATFGAARVFRTIMCWEYSYTGTLAFDDSAFAQHAGGTAVASGSITTTGTDEAVVAGYGEYSSNTLSSMQINGVAGDHTHQLASPNFTATWDRVVTAPFTGQATATLSGAQPWLAHVLALKVLPAVVEGCRLLQDGTSFRLLQDGTSKRLFQAGAGSGCAGGGGPTPTYTGWYGSQGWH